MLLLSQGSLKLPTPLLSDETSLSSQFWLIILMIRGTGCHGGLTKKEQSCLILGGETLLVLFPVFNKQTTSSLGLQCQIKMLNKFG